MPTLWVAIVRHDPFFWDTVQLGSKHAHFFFDNGLRWQVLPGTIDSGHPPLLGYYLACCWRLFGKTLAVSHWAMWPYLFGAIFFAFRIGRVWASPTLAAGFVLLSASDPVFATQASLISPDLVLISFFLCALYGIWSGNKWLVAVGVLGLCLISMRGMMTGAALLTWSVLRGWQYFRRKPVELFRQTLPFFPGFLAAFAFHYWHFLQAGWIGYHAGSPWAEAFERSDGAGLFRNAAVLVWRWLDFGRIAEWGVLGLLLLQYRKGLIGGPPGEVVLLAVIITIVLSPSALLYDNLSAHRYFLPAFTSLHLLLFVWIASGLTDRIKRVLLLSTCCAVLACGHFWIYPRGISMDWDCTLAHRSYHTLRADMLSYLAARDIRVGSVGSAFPNLATGEEMLLNGDTTAFAPLDIERQRYVLTSNVFNDIDMPQYRYLAGRRRLEKRLECAGVWMELYAEKD